MEINPRSFDAEFAEEVAAEEGRDDTAQSGCSLEEADRELVEAVDEEVGGDQCAGTKRCQVEAHVRKACEKHPLRSEIILPTCINISNKERV